MKKINFLHNPMSQDLLMGPLPESPYVDILRHYWPKFANIGRWLNANVKGDTSPQILELFESRIRGDIEKLSWRTGALHFDPIADMWKAPGFNPDIVQLALQEAKRLKFIA